MERNIYGYRCRRCDTLHYPFRMRCRECGQNDFFEFDPVALPTHGRLLTFTFVHNLPAEYDVARRGRGGVELEKGIRKHGPHDHAQPEMGREVHRPVGGVRQETNEDF